MAPWHVGVLRGLPLPFPLSSSAFCGAVPVPSYYPSSFRVVARVEVTLDLLAEGSVGLAPPPSLGFSSRLFEVWRPSGSWRLLFGLLVLLRFVDVSCFQLESVHSVLLSVHPGAWMASFDLREVFLQIPVHPVSRPFLRNVANGHVCQFQALGFGLSTAPQVFPRVLAPVSAVLLSLGVRIRSCLGGWLAQSSSPEAILSDFQFVLDLGQVLDIVVTPRNPTSFPLLLSCFSGWSSLPDLLWLLRRQFASPGSCLLLVISALRLAPRQCLALYLLGVCFLHGSSSQWGGLRMRSLQLCLHQSWVRVGQWTPVPWSPD